MYLPNYATDSLIKGFEPLSENKGSEKRAHKCQRVLENLYDSRNAYKTCAEDCKDLELKLLFQRVATNRSHLIDQLSRAIRDDFRIEP